MGSKRKEIEELIDKAVTAHESRDAMALSQAACNAANAIRTVIDAEERIQSNGILADDDRIKQMVNRFLIWKLPEDFNPDGGISFHKAINQNRPDWPQKNEPVGTNLFDATQAEAMIRYLLSE